MMKRSIVVLLIGLGAASAVVMTCANAADKNKPEVIKTEAKDTVLGRTIDFPGTLSVEVPTLVTLGGRIDQAREQADPVCLALAAKELEAAEMAGGKTAAIKSSDLEKEAVEMVGRRGKTQEIKMVKALLSGAESQKKLGEALSMAVEKNKGITGNCHVNNTSGRTVAIYINDKYVGWIPENGEADFFVGNNPWDNTKLFARSGAKTWGPRFVANENSSYTWNLVP
jgi:hypothetical protein